MNFRNPVYNHVGTVDLEYEHPHLGWIPLTASPDDPEPLGRDLYDAALTAGSIRPYTPPPLVVPDRVSSRQFGLQLIAAGIMDQVEGWIATQDAATQWAYAHSATFVRTDEMMQVGFAALGFTPGQIDAFFIAASTL